MKRAARPVFPDYRSVSCDYGKAQTSKVIKSGGFFGSWLGNLEKKALINIAIPFAGNNLYGLVSNLTSNAINKFERKINGKGAVRAGKGFILFILNKDMNNIIKVMKLLQDSRVIIDVVTETVKGKIKKTGSFVITFSRFNSAPSNFFSSKIYNWKRS